MSQAANGRVTRERTVAAISGWSTLTAAIILILVGAATFVISIRAGILDAAPMLVVAGIAVAMLLVAAAVFLFIGMFTLQPNEARVLILFGSYQGTVRQPGFHFANPFYARSRGKAPPSSAGSAGANAVEATKSLLGLNNLPTKISLRVRNFESTTLKVNDKAGNPIEIAAVVVWRVADTAQAVFDVQDFSNYVRVQAESAIRHIASSYAYDQDELDQVTLRSGSDEIAAELTKELQARLSVAGVVVDESRLTQLAYAPEIASAMLRRQQAEAIIAARNKIVQGAVSMVEMALSELEAKAVVKLDEERRAAMVSNLLVVLCGTSEAAPVINAGTLYN